MNSFNDFLVFVDESGDHGLVSIDPHYPIFVLAFCLIEKKIYSEKIVPSILNFKFKYFGHDQIILHEHDIRKAKKPFDILQNANIKNPFYFDLNRIIEESNFLLFASVIAKDKFTKKYAYSENPYHIAMGFGLERIFLHLNGLGCKIGTTYFVFESRGKKEDNDLELEFRRVCNRNSTRQKLPFDIIISDKKTNNSGLQLADLTARPIGRNILKPEQENRAYEIIKTKFGSDYNGNIIGWGLKLFP